MRDEDAPSKYHHVCVNKDAVYGCRRGSSCTCGVPQTDGTICHHITSVAKSGQG